MLIFVRSLFSIVVFFSAFSLLTSCGSDEVNSPVDDDKKAESATYITPPENGVRDWLTLEELRSGQKIELSPYHNDYYMPVGEAQAALHGFNGELSIMGAQLSGFPANFPLDIKQFPTFSAHFVAHQGYLLPSNRDIIIPDEPEQTGPFSTKSYWRIILSPGRVWSESTDQGLSRASFPFTLVEKSWNSAFNGLATFLFDDDEVSGVSVQLVQHTAVGLTHEASAFLKMAYRSTPQVNTDSVIATFDQEMAGRLPVRPWQALVEQFTELDWSGFNSEIAQVDVSAGAVWYQGTLYMQDCMTKYGPYPYCRFMRHGVYSATKSAGGAIALTHLAQRYGAEVLDFYIKDYVNVTANHSGWDKVRFIDALNMATGVGRNDADPDSHNVFADETGEHTGDWNRANSAKDKLDIEFTHYGDYPWGPGEILRYNTHHTFVLAVAMDKLVREREGKGLWQLLKEDVYQPIGIAHSPMMHTNEPDGSRGVPVMGIGMYPTVEDMIKIARLFHHSGEFDGRQLLHRQSVKKALYRTPEQGLISHGNNNEFGEGRYLMSFWSLPWQGQTGCRMQLPFMAGAGGNYVVIQPNGVIALRFSDSNSPDKRGMVELTSRLTALCDDDSDD